MFQTENAEMPMKVTTSQIICFVLVLKKVAPIHVLVILEVHFYVKKMAGGQFMALLVLEKNVAKKDFMECMLKYLIILIGSSLSLIMKLLKQLISTQKYLKVLT